MTDKIILKDGKELIGIANIVISEIEDKIFINNSSTIEGSITGALAVYNSDGSPFLIGSGDQCIWDHATSTLKISKIQSEIVSAKIIDSAESIESVSIETENLNSKYIKNKIINSECAIISNYIESEKISAKKWIGFNSKQEPGTHPYRLSLEINKASNKERLVIVSSTSTTNKIIKLIAFEDSRVYLSGVTNIQSTTIESSIGMKGDIEGDISLDKNFIYYCVKNFDGVTKIWKRCPLTDWE